MEAMAEQIQGVLCGTANPVIEWLQVVPDMELNPTTPSIDIYPGEDFAVYLGYGTANVEYTFVVRARVSTADSTAGKALLLSMMDRRDETSVALAILSDDSLGGVVDRVDVVSQTGYGMFANPDPQGDSLLGSTWTVRVYP